MYNRKDTESNASEEWKFWTVYAVAMMSSAWFGFVQGAHKMVDVSEPYEFQVGTVIGAGLAPGLIVWLLTHFLAIRAASRSVKWMVFFSITLISMFAALLGWTINAS